MKTHDLTFSDRPKLSIASKLLYEARDVGSRAMVKSFRPVTEEETTLMIEMIKQSCSSSSSTMVNLSEMLVSLMNGVVCRVALGRKHSGRKFKELLGEVVELLGVLIWETIFHGLLG
ncbi:hypothetical protein ACSBR2_023865 [Camellia fascicularis]